MPWNVPDHPDIVEIEKYGYPLRYLNEKVYCERCGKEVSTEDHFYSNDYDTLCVECYLTLCGEE